MERCSRSLKGPHFIKAAVGKEQATLIEEDISGNDQEMSPNVKQADDECKNGSPMRATTATKLQSRA